MISTASTKTQWGREARKWGIQAFLPGVRPHAYNAPTPRRRGPELGHTGSLDRCPSRLEPSDDHCRRGPGRRGTPGQSVPRPLPVWSRAAASGTVRHPGPDSPVPVVHNPARPGARPVPQALELPAAVLRSQGGGLRHDVQRLHERRRTPREDPALGSGTPSSTCSRTCQTGSTPVLMDCRSPKSTRKPRTRSLRSKACRPGNFGKS